MYIVIFLLICIFALWDYHKTILIYPPLRIFLHTGVCLSYTAPIIQVDFACCVVFLMLSLIKRARKPLSTSLRIGYTLMFISFFIAIFTSSYSFIQAVPPMFGRFVMLSYSILFFRELKDSNSVQTFYRANFVLMWLLIIYGLFEFLTNENPIMDYERDMFPDDLNGLIYSLGDRMGHRRCQSFTAIAISYGVFCALWGVFVLMTFKEMKKTFPPSLLIVSFLFAMLGVYTSGSKSPFIFVSLFLVLYIITFRSSKLKVYAIFAFVISFILASPFIYNQYLMVMDSSLVGEDGSDLPMRIMQFSAAGNLLDSNSWIFGLGAKGVMRGHELDADLLGSESIWLQVILEQGLIGVCSYIIIHICLYIHSKHQLNSNDYRTMAVFIISWIVLNSVTSLPGIDISYFFCFCYAYIILKQSQIKTIRAV